jgi:hypothetical protein
MAFSVFQAGSSLYGLDPNGLQVALTLPDGVFLNPTLKPRFAVMGNYAIMVNSPSRPLTIDANLNVRVLCPNPPSVKPTLSGTAGGSLSGTYTARQTFVVFDAFGQLIAESDFGPTADEVTISGQYLTAADLNLSSDQVSGSRLYRPTTGTSVYFRWIDQPGNTQTSIFDDLSDAGLDVFSAPARGTPPDLALVAEYKSRLFGISKSDPNSLNYTEVGEQFAWPADNVLPIPRLGSDSRGGTGLVRRRDALGLGRANGFFQVTGTSDTDLRIVNVSENCGIEAPDSVAVYRDTAYFLWKDGVYRWNADGLKCVSDGKVRSWFTTNNTFNISRLKNAFAVIDPLRHKYRLYLASASSQVENCWIEYDFLEDKWWGPHTSKAMNPSCAFQITTGGDSVVAMVGATDGFIRQDRKLRTDDTDTGIDFDVITARDDYSEPSMEKYFGQVSVFTKPQPRGSLEVVSLASGPDDKRTRLDLKTADQHDLTESSGRLSRVGSGQSMKIRFRNNEPGVDVVLRGYEVDPVYVTGKR